MYMGGSNMTREPEIDKISLCFDCPLNAECGTALMPGFVISCGKKPKANNEA